MRQIKSAAIRIDGKQTFEGPTHYCAFIAAMDAGIVTENDFATPRHEEGFTLNTGEFLSRDDAFTLAKQNGQAKCPKASYLDAMEVTYDER